MEENFLKLNEALNFIASKKNYGGNVLICTVGNSYAGKTSYCGNIRDAYGVPIVSPDAIRLSMGIKRTTKTGEIRAGFDPEKEETVWSLTNTMVDALFLAGHKVVLLDATNTTKERRKVWIDRYECAFVQIETPLQICLSRARQNGDEEMLPIIESQYAKLYPEKYKEYKTREEKLKREEEAVQKQIAEAEQLERERIAEAQRVEDEKRTREEEAMKTLKKIK